MPSASAIRLQVESALAARIPSALTPTARMVRPVAPTGIDALDEALHGGLPVGAITELVGPECSGRTSVALSFVAGMTQAGRVCAWLDVSNALDPASAAAAGVDLRRLLWVRCGARKTETSQAEQRFALPRQYLVPKPAIKGLHGGGCGGHPRGEVKGMARAVSGLLQPNIAPRCAEPLRRDGARLGVSAREVAGAKAPTHFAGSHGPAKAVPLLQSPRARIFSQPLKVATDFGGSIGTNEVVPFHNVPELSLSARSEVAPFQNHGYQRRVKPALREQPGKPWARLDQALRAADLLLQGGGFSAIVLDLGSLAPEFASRVPLATWFRYRAAAESTQASLLLLAQYGCAKSSAELTLRLEPGDALQDEPTVFTGMAHSVEVARRRFTGAQDNVVPLRKPPQRANAASWQSHASWAGVR
jgi:recombination protein RecA